MNITAADEMQHASSPDLHWKESCYFCFHDNSGQVGGMVTIGVFPNQHQAEGFAAIFLHDRILFYSARGLRRARDTSFFSVTGIVCEPLFPLRKWSFAAAADFSQVNLDQVHKGVRPATTVPAGFSLIFHGLSPIYDHEPSGIGSLRTATRRFEQTGRIEGRISVEGKMFPVSGLGSRNRSWGLPDLSSANDLLAIYAQISPHLSINAVRGVCDGNEIAAGYVFRGGVNTTISDIQVAVEMDPLSNLPTTAEAEIATEDGHSFRLQAEMNAVMPILLDQPKGQVQWYGCSACCSADRESGYGIIEVTKLV